MMTRRTILKTPGLARRPDVRNPGAPWASDRGFAFVMALVVALFVAGIATTLSVVSSTESQIAGNYIESKQTTCLAEAGIQHALWQLSQDPSNRVPLVAQGLDGSKYDALILSLGDSRYRILARGRSATAFGTGVSVDVAVFPQAFNYAVVTPSFTDETLEADIRGALNEGTAPEVVINLSTLAALADWYIPSSVTFYTSLEYDGIIYVNGSVTLRGSANWIEGTIIAKDDIKIDLEYGYAHFAGMPGMPALIAGHDVLLGKSGKHCDISVRGGAICSHDMIIEEYNEVFVTGVCIASHKFQIMRYSPNPTIIWDPGFRLRPPPGISQVGSYAWIPLPDTWQILTDLTPFESL